MTANPISSAGAGDPYQMLLVRGEGADGSKVFTDSSPKARPLTAGGNAFVDASASAAGNSSIGLDSASYVSAAASADFNYGTGPFTIDLWFAPAALPPAGVQAALLMQAGSNAADTTLGGAGLELFGNELYFVGNIGGTVYHPFYGNALHTQPLTAGTWYHAAVTRNNNTVTLFLNGVIQSSAAVSGAANNSSGSLSIGRYGDFNGDYFTGWIDNVDVAKGIARWSSSFSTTTLPQ
jgi:hypothetical protein